MNVRFAGSKHLDERRRRRLAGAASSPEISSGQLPNYAGRAAVSQHAFVSFSKDPLVKVLVPQRLAPYVLAGLAIGAVVALSVVGGHNVERTAQWIGPELAAVFDPRAGRLPKFFSTVLLLLTAQLSLLIWWMRSSSLRDFQGRYRVWTRAAAVWFAFAFTLNTGTHDAFGRTVVTALYSVFGVNLWRAEPLFWLVPSGLVGLSLLRQLGRDMRGCRQSLPLLWAGAVLCLLAAVGSFGADSWFSKAWSVTVQPASLLFAHGFLFLSMWLHARYVLYVSVDPPQKPAKEREKSKTADAGNANRAEALPNTDASSRVEAAELKGASWDQRPSDSSAVCSESRHDGSDAQRSVESETTPNVGLQPDDQGRLVPAKAGTRADADDVAGSAETADAPSNRRSQSACPRDATNRIDTSSDIPKPHLKGLTGRERKRRRKNSLERQGATHAAETTAST